MSGEKMLEKAARAMYELAGRDYREYERGWSEETPECKSVWNEHAKAALLAIRIPTMDAGLIGAPIITDHMKGNADYSAACDSFTAIIDAILNEET